MTINSESISLIETKTTFNNGSNGKRCTDNVLATAADTPKTGGSLKKPEYNVDIVWINVIGLFVLHVWGVYGLKLMVFDVSWKTILFCFYTYYLAGSGITAGAHRLWCHRAYSAHFLLRMYLAFCNCISFQNCLYDWCRDHRLHHKYTETDADPYNAKRGFFFAQLGWLMCKKHPDITEKGKGLDLSDLRADPIVMFQRKYYLWLCAIFSMYLPAAVPHYLWGENLCHAFYVCFAVRYLLLLHAQGYVNSGAHLWGDRPYDKAIQPAENVLATILTCGEGFHNYHHTFPWDYSTSEWGWNINLTTQFIDMCAWLGLAYNLKKVPQETIDSRRENKGDGSKVWYPEILHKSKKAN